MLEVRVALVAVEAGWVKALTRSLKHTPSDRSVAAHTESAGLPERGGVMGFRLGNRGCVRVKVLRGLLCRSRKGARRRIAWWKRGNRSGREPWATDSD